MKLNLIIVAALLIAAQHLGAQVVADNSTNTLSNVTNNFTGDVIVGTNGSFTLLMLGDNSLLTNSNNGIIGLNSTAKSNEVRLVSPTSRWQVGGTLLVGSNGVASRLVVSNGAVVESLYGNIGPKSAASNHSVLITGAGSLWTNQVDFAISGGIFVNSRSNQVVISNGGVLESGGAASVAGSGSQVLVAGSGSRWASHSEFTWGGTSNYLEVSDGAVLVTSNATITDLTSSGNRVLIAGAGTVWTNSQDLTMGFGSASVITASNGAAVFLGGRASLGALANFSTMWITDPGTRCTIGGAISVNSSGNLLVVSNGGFLISSNTVLGPGLGGSFNSALVTGTGTMWTNKDFLYIGGSDGNNQVLVSGGGALTVGGPTSIGTNFGANLNSAAVSGLGSAWTNFGPLRIGDAAASNSFQVSNGGRLESFVATVGFSSGASNNQATVTGSNSFWNASANLDIGSLGSRNQFVVINGGSMQNTSGNIGSFSGANNNIALVTGAGSSWTNLGELRVGYGGSGSQLVVSNAGLVSAQGVVVGRDSTSLNNRSVVDGGTLISSKNGSGALDVRHGTNVLNAGLINTDLLILTNKGSVFPSSSFGNGGSISIPSGGTASPYPSTITMSGFFGVVTKVTVTLSNLSHTFPSDLDIVLVSPTGQKVMLMSDAGSSNAIANVRLNFDDTGAFLPSTGTITTGTYRPTDYVVGETLPSPAPAGPYSSSLASFNGNSPNGTWRLYVNDAFTPNGGSLVGWGIQIATDENGLDRGMFEFNGGTLITRGAIISNNTPFVVGFGGGTPAIWDVRSGPSNTVISGDLVIGNNTSFNQLFLTNGALMTNSANSSSAFVGRQFGANSNSVTLANPGSLWHLDDGVVVGSFGSGNRLSISNGATLVTGSSSAIGNEFVSSNNEAVVSGPGSTWISPLGFLFLGGGPNNRLVVSDGGAVVSFAGRLGNTFAESSNNLAVVTGAGSSWSNVSSLIVGDTGPRNQVIVSNSAQLIAIDGVYIGYDSTSTNNQVTVDNGTMRATNATSTGVLDVRHGIVTLKGGLVEVDRLLVTNVSSGFVFNGGTLKSRNTTITNGLDVGNGTSDATFILVGNGTHTFNGLAMNANGILAGNGTLTTFGGLVALTGGTISPGAPAGGIGTIVITTSPLLAAGNILMEISKNGAALTNDQIQVTTSLKYNSGLVVTNIGPGTLAAGDRFKLFSATTFSGSFDTITLPRLASGLTWTNKLLVDGSIEVAGAAVPVFSGITLSGSNVILSGSNGPASAQYAVLTATNLATPSINWLSLVTNQFDVNGIFSFTNPMAPGEPQRYFRIRTP